MKTNVTHKLLLLGLLVSLTASAAVVSRVTTFTDGSVLFASDLNAEFNNLVDGVNNINNDNIIAGAAIAPSKISSSIAGSGLSRDGSSGVLTVNVDNTTIEIGGSGLQVKGSSIDTAQIKDGAVTTAKIADLNVTAGKIAADAITTAKILDGAVTNAKLSAVGQQVSSSSGSFTSTSTTYIDVTNLTVTITTTGRPVFIGLIPDGTSVSSIGCFNLSSQNCLSTFAMIRVLSGTPTTIAEVSVGNFKSGSSATSVADTVPPGSLYIYDVPAAGTYTYKIQIKSAAGTTGTVSLVKLFAYEIK